ncbi:MAG TPA: family 1 glycosylhydrolase [Armatimonadota bacterium]|nr:family 1 glycosylhydrolase [Armatimonadota bacterium]
MSKFMFATGIENSYPTVAGGKRVDEMEKCGHYKCWKEDFQLVKEMGIQYLRYGPPYFKTHTGPGKYDWSFADETFNELKRLGIVPIADLCHFGVPDWIGNFQNTDWPGYFKEYARAFARRYPWIYLYTPVNEVFVCASFSGERGWWNERLKTDRGFVTALKNLCRSTVLGMEAILSVNDLCYFVQSESSEYYHPSHPDVTKRAEFFNEKRFLSLDLIYSNEVTAAMYQYLTDNGMSREEYAFFQGHGLKPYCIMGTDYYITNEHIVNEDGSVAPSGEIFGYYVITRQYYERYGLPVMHTETNITEDRSLQWLYKEWCNMLRLKEDGVPIVGFTWYSLTDQVDWDSVLQDDAGHVNPLGLYDLERKPRPVSGAYKGLIHEWREILPTQSTCLGLQR